MHIELQDRHNNNSFYSVVHRQLVPSHKVTKLMHKLIYHLFHEKQCSENRKKTIETMHYYSANITVKG